MPHNLCQRVYFLSAVHDGIPEAVLVVKVEERFFFCQALSRHACLAYFVGTLHARDRGRQLSADDTRFGFLRSRVVRIALFFRNVGLCGVNGVYSSSDDKHPRDILMSRFRVFTAFYIVNEAKRPQTVVEKAPTLAVDRWRGRKRRLGGRVNNNRVALNSNALFLNRRENHVPERQRKTRHERTKN